jgi:ceramide glucosyltransferase
MAATPMAVVVLALAVVSTVYWLYALACIIQFRRRHVPRALALPPVTILKPLCGAHPALYESLRSFCEQDYPDVQLVFGVRDPADPAIEVVQRLMNEYRARHLKLVVNERAVSVNPKVSNLVNLCASAEHDVLGVADSDIRVGPDYLRAVVAPLADPRVGLVTCLYRAGGSGRGWGALARLFIEEWFFPSALVSATGARMRHGFGATLAFRRRTLDAIGGFEVVGAYLADDYMLGERIAARGEHVVLSPYVVETRVVERSFAALFFHELRWSRTMRAVRPIGYFLAALTYGFVWCALALVATGAAWPALAAAAAHVAVRLAVHRATQRALARNAEGERRHSPVWLLPLRDALSVVLWAAAFTGRTVRWGPQRFVIDLFSRLTRRA